MTTNQEQLITLRARKQTFKGKLSHLNERINSITIRTVDLEIFEGTKIIDSIKCDESLDVIKSVTGLRG